MKVLVIPDVHLKPWMYDQARKLLVDPDVQIDRVVCLGDIPDDFGKQKNIGLYEETFDTEDEIINEIFEEDNVISEEITEEPQDVIEQSDNSQTEPHEEEVSGEIDETVDETVKEVLDKTILNSSADAAAEDPQRLQPHAQRRHHHRAGPRLARRQRRHAGRLPLARTDDAVSHHLLRCRYQGAAH